MSVAKKDGTIDARPNDLQELCKDYVFYRGQILKKDAAGDEEGAAAARVKFQQVTRWLDDYPNDDVAAACK